MSDKPTPTDEAISALTRLKNMSKAWAGKAFFSDIEQEAETIKDALTKLPDTCEECRFWGHDIYQYASGSGDDGCSIEPIVVLRQKWSPACHRGVKKS